MRPLGQSGFPPWRHGSAGWRQAAVRADGLCDLREPRHPPRVAPLHRRAPGFRGACVLVVAALSSRLGVFPSIAMTRSFGGGGDSIAWGLHATTIADHLRYEGGWARHRTFSAFLIDASHPFLLLAVATLVAHLLVSGARRLPRRVRVVGEHAARRAALWAYGVFGVVLLLKALLWLGVVRGPRPILLAVVGAVLAVLFALTQQGASASAPRRALRSLGTLVGGLPLLVALLTLFAIADARVLPHVPWAWAVGAGAFAVAARGLALARRRARGSELR